MALFIPVDGNVEVILRTEIAKKIGSYVAVYPRQMKIDSVKGKSGRVYFFDIYVDEEGLVPPSLMLNAECKQGGVNGSLSNYRASLLANPLKPNFIVGNAVLVPYNDRMKYTEADFANIYYGVCVEDDESNVKLVEENIKSRQRRRETIAKIELTLNEPRLRKGYSPSSTTAQRRVQAGWCIDELREMCREMGIPITGTKNTLCNSLLEELQ